jgi:hypothetical protein
MYLAAIADDPRAFDQAVFIIHGGYGTAELFDTALQGRLYMKCPAVGREVSMPGLEALVTQEQIGRVTGGIHRLPLASHAGVIILDGAMNFDIHNILTKFQSVLDQRWRS